MNARLSRRAWFAAAGSLGALALAGCASWDFAGIQPNTDEAAVRARFGNPTATYPDPNGGTRWQYSKQPWGRVVYNVDFDAAGRVTHVEQALQSGLFEKHIKSGTWTTADALYEYGPPAYTMGVANFHGTIWVYRYANGPTWRLLYLDVAPDGIVKSWSRGDEPMPDFDSR